MNPTWRATRNFRWRSASIAAVVVIIATAPRAAQAIPVLANGAGGVSCGRCHSAPPNLNAYGRYILGTNFVRGLDAHQQMQESLRDPVSVEIDGNGSNTIDAGTAKVSGSGRFLGGGYLGSEVTYYASVPVVSHGVGSAAVDQAWAAYNGFSSGNASVQVGKFPTPVFAPWLSQSLSLAGYSLAAMPVGLNAVGVGDNRWGASYTQIARDGLVGTAAYITNSGPAEGAFHDTFGTSGEGQSFVGSLQFLTPTSHLTGGIATLTGTFPLPSGAKDSFNRAMALLSYSPSDLYSINAMALVGRDLNPNDGASPAAGSNGLSLEAIYNPESWVHLNLRYERTNDGLGLRQNNYVTDVAFNPLANLIVTLENVSSVGQRPAISYQLLWAGPWIRRPFPKVASAQSTGTIAAAPAPGSAVTSPAPGSAVTSPAPGSAVTSPAPGSAVTASGNGKPLYAANCASCHGASGQGGVGPDLRGIATRLKLAATVDKIERPSGLMPKLYPSPLSAAQVSAIATYIQAGFH